MTDYVNRIAFLTPIGQYEACNRAANALGRTGMNFSVRLSADGEEPATHIGGSTTETDNFVLAVTNAAVVTPPSPELAPADWAAVADHLVVVSGSIFETGDEESPVPPTDPVAQFNQLLSTHGLQRIEENNGEI